MQREGAAIMGVINTTPDSFSDGGLFVDASSAIDHGLKLVEQGADILDIGGESTRPGAEPVQLQQELDRVLPVIEGLATATDALISIDTSKPGVMTAAAVAGAGLINDVYALRAEGALQAAAATRLPVCLMHMQGNPRTMQETPEYEDVVGDVSSFLLQRVDCCVAAGINHSQIVIDPGIGFGKLPEHNLQLLRALPRLQEASGCQLLIGVSRKSLIQAVLGRGVKQRLAASLGLAVQAVLNGAKIVRVHDVRPTFDAVRMVESVARA